MSLFHLHPAFAWNDILIPVQRHVHLKTTTNDKFPNETLIRNGFLGCAPLKPSIALTIRTLHAFRQMQRNCARLSSYVQSWTNFHSYFRFLVLCNTIFKLSHVSQCDKVWPHTSKCRTQFDMSFFCKFSTFITYPSIHFYSCLPKAIPTVTPMPLEAPRSFQTSPGLKMKADSSGASSLRWRNLRISRFSLVKRTRRRYVC